VGYRPQIPVLSALFPQLNLLNSPEKKFLAKAPPPEKNFWVRHWSFWSGENTVSVRPMETDHEIDVKKLWSELRGSNTFPQLIYSAKQLRFIECVVYD
jgi:hypothetical protein